MVGAVDRHADVVQQRAGGDHDLGVAPAHPVVGDHRRLDPGLDQQPQQAQRDVEHDLDVDPGVVRHPEPLRGDLGHVPPGAQLGVGVHPLEQRLEPPVATRRGADPRALDRLRGSGAALVWPGGALGFPAPSTLTSGVCQARRRRSRAARDGVAECRLARGVPSRQGCREVDSSARAAMRPARLRPPSPVACMRGPRGLLVPECTCEACHLELMREHAPGSCRGAKPERDLSAEQRRPLGLVDRVRPWPDCCRSSVTTRWRWSPCAVPRSATRSRSSCGSELAEAFGRPRRRRRASAASCSPAPGPRSAPGWTRRQFGGDLEHREAARRDEHASPSRRWATAGVRSSRPSTARRSPAGSRWRCCATCGSPRPRRSSAIPSCRGASRRATRPRGRCSRRRSPRSSA